jgi:hypothetical protein
MAYGKNSKKQTQRETTPPALIAWHVTERGEKKFWNRIGAAWEHEDGEGLTLQLELIPVIGGRIVLRAPKQDEETEAKAPFFFRLTSHEPGTLSNRQRWRRDRCLAKMRYVSAAEQFLACPSAAVISNSAPCI